MQTSVFAGQVQSQGYRHFRVLVAKRGSNNDRSVLVKIVNINRLLHYQYGHFERQSWDLRHTLESTSRLYKSFLPCPNGVVPHDNILLHLRLEPPVFPFTTFETHAFPQPLVIGCYRPV